jgi:hypothetical protein
MPPEDVGGEHLWRRNAGQQRQHDMKGYREGGEAWEDRMITWNAMKGSTGSGKQRGGRNQPRSMAAVEDVEDDVDACGVPRFDSRTEMKRKSRRI